MRSRRRAAPCHPQESASAAGARRRPRRAIRFPLAEVESPALDGVRAALGGGRPFALINPGAAWPNKRWPPERFGEVAAFLRDVRGLPSVVLWGPGEEGLAGAGRRVRRTVRREWRRRPRSPICSRCRARGRAVVRAIQGRFISRRRSARRSSRMFGPTDPQRNGRGRRTTSAVSRYGVVRLPLRAPVPQAAVVPRAR